MKLLPLVLALAVAVVPSADARRSRPVKTPAPVAVFSVSPSSPVTGSAVTFNASGSTCSAPCSYAWSDDGGTLRPSSELWPLGAGVRLSFTFHEAGVKYVRLVVTDGQGRTATVEHNVTVKAPVVKPPPKEEPPKEETKPPPKEEVPSGEKNCLNSPHVCGYPDATNSGVPAGTVLTAHAGETISSPGIVKDLSFSGELTVDASNVTVEDDQLNEGVNVVPGLSNVTITHSSCVGDNIQNCVFAKSKAVLSYDYFTGCGECTNGAVTIEDSYLDVSAVIPGEHYEAVYYGGGEGSLILNHNTMFSPNHAQGETAVIFASVDFGNQTTLTIDNNLLAGGNYTIYGGGSGSGGKVLGPVTVQGNRFSRKYDPNGGYYGVASYFNEAVTTWSGNVWDETLAPVEGP